MVKSLKMGQPALYVVDNIQVPLTDLCKERATQFLKDNTVAAEGASTAAPQLVINIAATHAGIITRNNAFYQPSTMKDGMSTFTRPFSKPVQTHHNDHADPIGRVIGADYVDISNRYTQPIQEFKNRFGGKTIFDSTNIPFQDAKDQLRWVLDNLVKMNDYSGLGYGKLQAVINDKEAAEKILDQRYLTVSVGFTTTEARCSVCSQDWAGEGPCEHTPGSIYDEYPMVLLPQTFLYDEVSFVNNPADQFAQVETVQQVAITNFDTIGQDSAKNSSLVDCTPILLGVTGNGAIYRLNYRDNVRKDREVITVSTKKVETPELVEGQGAKWPKEASVLLGKDASRKHYLAEEGKSDHKHRVMIDPATGNGYTDWVDGHSHEVVNMKVRKGGKMDYDEETGKFKTDNEHVHPMGKEIERLFDNNMSKKNTIQDGSGEGGANSETTSMKKSAPGAKTTPRGKVNKGPGKRLKKTLFGGGPGGTVDESKKSELEVVVPEDFEVPEGWVVSEDGLEDVEYDVETIKALEELESSKQLELDDAQPPKSEGSKDHPKMKKSKKAKKRTNINGGGEAIEKDSVLELDENEEIPEDYLVIENTSDITDETCNDSDKFYDEFFVPEILKIADEDAIMSSEDRSKLGSAEACGPSRS